MNIIKEIHQFIHQDFQEMNNVIMMYLKAKEDLVEEVGKYLINAGGKRIRPLMTILCAKMCQYNGKHHITLATAVEFIHAATLLHDDVVDESEMRRFKPTANKIWGSKTSILVGDFLFSQSFKLMVSTESVNAMKALSRASAIIAEGEVSQLVQLKQKRIISIAEYNQVINAKTAELFAAACQVGGIIAERSDEDCKNLWHFGMVFGAIFQIIDDLLDYFGNAKQIGKNIGDDFFEGKVTIPLVLLYNKINKSDQDYLLNIISQDKRSFADFNYIKELLVNNNIKEDVLKYVNTLQNEALVWINKIELNNQYKDYLILLLNNSTEAITNTEY